MVSKHIDDVANIAVAANDRFKEQYPEAKTSAGVISSNLREMGIAADAVNIDCEHSGQRLALILLEQSPDRVGIGIGMKDTVGDYELITQLPVDELDESVIFDILSARFSVKPQ